MRLKIYGFVLLVITGWVYASEKVKMGVLDLESLNMPQSTAVAVSDMLRTELFSTGRFTIVDKKNMDKILKEQAFQKTGCTTTDCAVEVGRILNTSSMITGSLSKIGSTLTVTLNLVDIERAEVIMAESTNCSSEDELSGVTKKLAISLASKIPVIGKVVRPGDTEVIVDLGTVDNVASSMKFIVNRLKEEIKDSSGNVIMKEWEDIGEIELTEVQEQASKAKVLSKKKAFMEGDVVRIGETIPLIVKEAPRSRTIIPSAGSVQGSAFDSMWRSVILPGWGQFYNKDEFKGWLFLTSEAVALTISVTSYLNYQSKYTKYKSATVQSDIEHYYQDANKGYQDFKSYATIAAGIWALNIVDALISFDPSKNSSDLNNKVFCKFNGKNINFGYSITW